jgi:lipid II:glycine glycyltransferase (peptidoglycan interpeptide bridge formation enzyme)
MVKCTSADLSVCDGADSFLQSAMWGAFKSRFGWISRAFLVDWSGAGERPLLVLSRRIAPGIAMAYVPWGPELPATFPPDAQTRTLALAECARELRRFLSPDTAFIRFDPPWFTEEKNPSAGIPALGAPFQRAAADIQPPDTVLLDLSPPLEGILGAMKPKWRYNIGLAEKRGVVVSRPGEQGIEVFYKLLAETARRDGIAIHSIEYYKTLFELCRKNNGSASPELCLYAAEHAGDALAAIVVLCRGNRATYLYGASANIKRNLMAPYALQWQAIQDAKTGGRVLYDLFGIPPNDDPAHPMAGLYRFKTGFGGAVVHRPGSWDYRYKPLPCALFTAAEKIRKKVRDMGKHKR